MAFSATFTENSRTALKKFIAENKPVAPNSYSDLRNHHPSRSIVPRQVEAVLLEGSRVVEIPLFETST
jgi:hypothetical protein